MGFTGFGGVSVGSVVVSMPAQNAGVSVGSGLEKLTRRHAIKMVPTISCSVEECSLAVGELVGYASVRSASRMNSAVVIFLDSVEKVNQVVESGVVVQGTFIPVLSLVSPARKIIISNVPPFIRNEVLEKELARHGQLLSPIKLIPMSCRSPHLKHVVSFRRQVLMIMKSPEELNLALKFKIENFDYTVHVTSGNMKCFRCGTEGHLIRECPRRDAGDRRASAGGAGPASAGGAPVSAGGAGPAPAGGAPVSAGGAGPAPAGGAPTSDSVAGLAAAVSAGGTSATAGDAALVSGCPVEPGAGPAVLPDPVVEVAPSTHCPEPQTRVERVAAHNGMDTQVTNTQVEGTRCMNNTDSGEMEIGGLVVETARVAAVLEEVEEDDDDGVIDDELLKLASKRKFVETRQSRNKAKKASKDRELSQSQGQESLFDSDDEEEEEGGKTSIENAYSAASIKKFLQDTKGVKGVQVENFFPDLELFLESIRFYIRKPNEPGQPGFSDPEVHRLRKWVTRVNLLLTDDD